VDSPVSRLPPSARLAWWGTSWLRGHVGPDDLLDAVLDGDVAHPVLATDGVTGGLVPTLAALRREGATLVGAAFPVAGDPCGLGGPRELTDAALEAGEAVVMTEAEAALVPRRVGPTVEWSLLPAARRPLVDVGEADRDLRAALLDAANRLAELDVARWRPEVADRLLDLRERDPLTAPPGVPARCVDLAARALRAREVVDLAQEDDGGAASATEARHRRDALDPLARAARRALVAACSPEVWPPD
jgi:hypothetical protein